MNINKIKQFIVEKGIFNFLPDKVYLKLIFRLKMHKKLDLENPQTFNEKIQWLKLYDRNPEYVKMVDKFEAKKYITEIVGEKYVVPTIGVYDKFEDIDFEKLPNQFVIKCTHDSGGLVICNDKSKLNIEEARNKINKCLKRNYYYRRREWTYKDIKPRIIIEELLKEENIFDYKFFCFNGEPKLLFVATDRGIDTRFNFYDLKFNKLNLMQHYKNSDRKIEKPKNFEKMIELSKKLSKGIPHVRVDFYDINGKLYCGELTFYHFSGMEKFEPEEYDKIIGDMLELPKSNSL